MMKQQLCDLYHLVKAEVDKVDFSNLWDEFAPLRFALYDQELCCFDGDMIEITSDFLANTAINYHGEWIAIWNVSDEIDPKILASKMVHEMFHGFQHANQESRFPNELHALYAYRYSDENLSVKLEENRLLAELSQEFRPAMLERFLALRKYRFEHFRNEFLYEAQVEQIEGSANYVELNALKQLCPEAYEKKLCKIQKSITEPNNLLPIRIPSYDIGALLLHILKENHIPFDEAFSAVTFAEALIADVQAGTYNIPSSMAAFVDAYYAQAQRTVNEALEKNDIVTDKESALLGVNFYNAVFWNHYIISKYFVMYGDNDAPTIVQGNFVIETHQEGILSKIYRLS